MYLREAYKDNSSSLAAQPPGAHEGRVSVDHYAEARDASRNVRYESEVAALVLYG